MHPVKMASLMQGKRVSIAAEKCTPIEIPLLYVDPRKSGYLLGD